MVLDQDGLPLMLAREGGTAVLRVAGELDVATADLLRGALAPVVADPAVTAVVLDLAELGFCDVSGLRAALEAAVRLRQRGATLHLRDPSPLVRRVLALLDLEQDLPVQPRG